VLSVFGAAAGMNLPRVAAQQSQEGDSVEKQNFRKEIWCFSHTEVAEFLTWESWKR
jgi:lipoprotein Spr